MVTKSYLVIILALFLIGGILAVVFFNSTQQEITDIEKTQIDVVVTIPPYAEFVKKIGGDLVSVSVMVPVGASPHTYEPTPSQLMNLSHADVYVKVGTPVEFEINWLDKLVEINGKMLMVDSSKGIELLEGIEEEDADHDHGGLDPHVWTSPVNVKIIVSAIADGLIRVDEVNRNFYLQNRDAYLTELEGLDQKIRQGLLTKTGNEFIVFHPAWGYFAHEYNLEQIPIEQEGKEPTARMIQDVITQAQNLGIKVVIASPEVSSKSADVIAKEIGGSVVFVSTLADNYVKNIQDLVSVLVEQL